MALNPPYTRVLFVRSQPAPVIPAPVAANTANVTGRWQGQKRSAPTKRSGAFHRGTGSRFASRAHASQDSMAGQHGRRRFIKFRSLALLLPNPLKWRLGPARVAAQKGLTYAAAGVDTARQKAAIRALAGAVTFRRKGRGKPIGGIGSFAGLIEFDAQAALAICTDGVGTKLAVARALGKWDTVGIDCIAMNVNDCICVGAEPLAFVDYIATQSPDADVARQIGIGLDRGARLANVTLAGGETAILPDLVNGLDLAGTCVGWVRRDRILDGSRVRSGDVILGLASTGLHSNGYTLARRILQDAGVALGDAFPEQRRRTVGQALLEPTHIYVREILRLFERADVHGLANITGGGLKNLPRVNPKYRYVLDAPHPVPPLFTWLQGLGGVSDEEMYKTFNMGMGFAVILPRDEVGRAKTVLRSFAPRVVGHVTRGKGCHLVPFDLEFESKT